MFKYMFYFLLFIFSNFVLSGDFSYYFKERLRFTSINNAITLNSDTDPDLSFSRTKTSIGFSYFLEQNLQFNACLTNEFRYYFGKSHKEFTFDEVFFEKLNIIWNLKDFKITFGRQNIILGEGFIMFDGSPLDGSRSAYFNGIRGDYKNKNFIFSLFVVNQPTTDSYLPILNNQEQLLIENKEKAYGFYGTYKQKNYFIDLYSLNKKVEAEGNNINTFGGRFSFNINKKTAVTAEFASQNGDYQLEKHRAYGGYSYINYYYKKYSIECGLIYLSGEKIDTSKIHEGWDSPFARWPKWSELYVYTQIIEFNGKVAYWSNLKSYYFNLKKEFNNIVIGKISYFKLYANELTKSSELLSGIGKNRGDLFTLKLSYSYSKHCKCHFQYEKFFPGNFYFNNAENADFLRVELSFNY